MHGRVRIQSTVDHKYIGSNPLRRLRAQIRIGIPEFSECFSGFVAREKDVRGDA